MKQFAVALSALALLAGCGREAADASLRLTLSEYAIAIEGTATTGPTLLRVSDAGDQIHELRVSRLSEGKSLADARAYYEDGGDGLTDWMTPIVTTSLLSPGIRTGVVAEFDLPGTYLFLCGLPDAEFTPHAALGMMTALEVAAATGEIPTAPTPDATIALTQQAPTWPPLAKGEQLLAFRNTTPLPIDVAVIDGSRAELDELDAWIGGGQVGEAPLAFFGGASIDPGAVATVLFDLDPGTYRLLTTIRHSDDDLEDRFTAFTVI